MQNDTWTARLIRGLVKTVFLGCYIAFMWASIHHVAAFFNNFEADNSNQIGSYMLAGAFDITALVTTIGVMFFRKSMPRWVFWIVWSFILATAFYSFFINWEYASHYQNITLIMQPTGETQPVYDEQGILHYVAVMRANTGLTWINPLLASGFTIFSLIYSVIAEFFGTKPPTMEELLAKKQYLEETTGLLHSIQELEGKSRGPSVIDRVKRQVLEVKSAVKEVVQATESLDEETHSPNGDNDIQATESPDEQTPSPNDANIIHLRAENGLSNGEITEVNDKWAGFTGRSTVDVETAASLLSVSINTVKDLRSRKVLKTASLNKQRITVASIRAYDMKRSPRNHKTNGEATTTPLIIAEETVDKLAVSMEAVRINPDLSDEELAQRLGMKKPASARFWKLKALDVLTRSDEKRSDGLEKENQEDGDKQVERIAE